MNKERNCQNCNHEELCNHDWSGVCKHWNPDIDYERELELERKVVREENYGN